MFFTREWISTSSIDTRGSTSTLWMVLSSS